jgi:hypothetical protein
MGNVFNQIVKVINSNLSGTVRPIINHLCEKIIEFGLICACCQAAPLCSYNVYPFLCGRQRGLYISLRSIAFCRAPGKNK